MSAPLQAEPPGANSFRLPPGFLALSLAIKYLLLTCYGVHAVWVQVPSFVSVGGELFAIVWAAVVAVLSLLALLAVARTWFTGRSLYEKWATMAVILGFLLYAIVLLVRGVQLGNWDGASLAWIPVALVVLPTFRYYQIVAQKAREAMA